MFSWIQCNCRQVNVIKCGQEHGSSFNLWLVLALCAIYASQTNDSAECYTLDYSTPSSQRAWSILFSPKSQTTSLYHMVPTTRLVAIWTPRIPDQNYQCLYYPPITSILGCQRIVCVTQPTQPCDGRQPCEPVSGMSKPYSSLCGMQPNAYLQLFTE